MKRTYLLVGLTILLVVLFSACVAPPPMADTAPQEEADDAAGNAAGNASGDTLTVDQLRNASYSGIYTETVTLADGVYEGEPFMEGGASRPSVEYIDGSERFGDLNNDSIDDAAVLLVENSGGSGVFTYVGAQLNENGAPVDVGTVWLGDRTQVAGMAIVDGAVTVDIVTQGPDDPQCCATLKVRTTLALQDGRLAETGSEQMGTVSLADLDGTSWQLIEPAPDQPVLPDVDVTLAFAGEELSGNGGCNQYSGSVSSEGGQQLAVGPLLNTSMACDEPILDQETAYLTALQGAMQWSYIAGDLSILYQTADGNVASLRYALASTEAETSTSAENTENTETIEATFVCPDGTSIDTVFDNSARTVTVALPDGTVTLTQVEAASGAKYSDGKTTFWNQGDEALVEVDGEMVYQGCVSQ